MIDFYVEQHEGFALGNFVNCTPTIKDLFERFKRPIPVLFRTDYVKECYKFSPYIKHIDEPFGNRLFGSDLINRRNDMPDAQYIAYQVLGRMPHSEPFIDEVKPAEMKSAYGVFVNGAGVERRDYLERKLVSQSFQRLIATHCDIPVIGTGSFNDQGRNIFHGSYGNIRRSLELIAGAKWVITNATGFYHVAGAMGKRQLALWKACQLPRNQNMNSLQEIVMRDQWNNGIKSFLARYGKHDIGHK